MRLIDADVLVKDLECMEVEGETFTTAVNFALIMIKEAPTVDLVDGWISVKDWMPEERYSIFARLKGTKEWRPAMFEKRSDDVLVAERYADGTVLVRASHTTDGKWEGEILRVTDTQVTHWMPYPKPPEESP